VGVRGMRSGVGQAPPEPLRVVGDVIGGEAAVDRQEPAGVYFGTNSGSVFASSDEGDHWSEIARHLPTVFCVETLERV